MEINPRKFIKIFNLKESNTSCFEYCIDNCKDVLDHER